MIKWYEISSWAQLAQETDEKAFSEKENAFSRVEKKLYEAEAWIGAYERSILERGKCEGMRARMCLFRAWVEVKQLLREYSVAVKPVSPRAKKAIKKVAKAIEIIEGVICYGYLGYLYTLSELRLRAVSFSIECW